MFLSTEYDGVTISDSLDSCNKMIKRVDEALYQSKNEAENRVTIQLSKRN
jgi:PleD family two-component response regulator